jgi:hypothetical protein
MRAWFALCDRETSRGTWLAARHGAEDGIGTPRGGLTLRGHCGQRRLVAAALVRCDHGVVAGRRSSVGGPGGRGAGVGVAIPTSAAGAPGLAGAAGSSRGSLVFGGRAAPAVERGKEGRSGAGLVARELQMRLSARLSGTWIGRSAILSSPEMASGRAAGSGSRSSRSAASAGIRSGSRVTGRHVQVPR